MSGKSIEARLVEILTKRERRGVASLSESERLADDVTSVLYRVVAGAVGGLRYNVTGADRKSALKAAKSLGSAEYSRWLEKAFAPRLSSAAEDALDDEFLAVEQKAHAALLTLLEADDEEQSASARSRGRSKPSAMVSPRGTTPKTIKKKKKKAKKKMPRAKATSRR